MASNLVPRGVLAAFAGATLAVLASSAPSSAFTLNAPSLAAPVASADIDPVYWHGRWHGGWHRGWGWHHGWGWRHRWGWHRRWGWGYHPWGWHRWGWRPAYGYGYGYGYGYYGWPVRRCWIDPWGFWHCRWYYW